MNEIWKPIAGFEGRYEVSNRGRVRSLRIRGTNYDRQRTSPRVLLNTPGPSGYPRVQFDRRNYLVHLLVCTAFNGACPEGLECAHLDGIRTNNLPENLKWVTRSENYSHRLLHGTDSRGERGTLSKLTTEQVRTIRSRLTGRRGELRAMAREYGVCNTAIEDIAKGKTWRLPEAGYASGYQETE